MGTTAVRSLLSCAVPLLLAGCLQFDAQDVTVHYDAAHDRFDALLVYRGLYGTETTAKDLEQLQHVRDTGQFAFWSNWPLLVQPHRASGVAGALAGHVDVENGTLFTTPQDQLCAYQFVRLRDVKGFLAKLNTLIAGAIGLRLEGEWGTDHHRLDDETKELLEDVVRGRKPVLSREGSALVATIPCSDADHRWFLRWIGEDLRRDAGLALGHQLYRAQSPKPEHADEAAGHGANEVNSTPDTQIATTKGAVMDAFAALPETRFLFENPVSLVRLEGRTVLTLGLPYGDESTFHKAPHGRASANLRQPLAEQKIDIEPGVPDEELQRRFLAFRGRDAVLPPELASKRPK